MKKIQIASSETQPDKFRLILNINDEFSVGSILTKKELKVFYNELRQALENSGDE